jgi:hypothetical protein
LRSKRLKIFDLPFKDDLSELSSGDSFEYADGVIKTEAALKGPVLKEILQKLPKLFNKIIFVDDREEQIQSVESHCCDMGIACIAFHYVPFQQSPPLNERIAEYQLKTLVNEYRWISDDEALQHLEISK